MKAYNLAATTNLVARVMTLSQKMEVVMGLIQSQANPIAKDDGDKHVATKEKEPSLSNSESDSSKTCNDNNDDKTTILVATVRFWPFRVEAWINIPSSDGSINVEALDAWFDQLDTYFTLYKCSNKVALMQLKLIEHALAWWNKYRRSNGNKRWHGDNSKGSSNRIRWATSMIGGKDGIAYIKIVTN